MPRSSGRSGGACLGSAVAIPPRRERSGPSSRRPEFRRGSHDRCPSANGAARCRTGLCGLEVTSVGTSGGVSNPGQNGPDPMGCGHAGSLAKSSGATCCSGDKCQSSGLYGPARSGQVRLGCDSGESGLIGCTCGLWNDCENDRRHPHPSAAPLVRGLRAGVPRPRARRLRVDPLRQGTSSPWSASPSDAHARTTH